ncbi:hypothetical protein SAMN05192529_11089 [Arachidicoccus rhizosphaerae]|uniref:Lipoprotein n=2 Tax=Arachidicoccus rhizosphaerae TaxID=551991 RepID=A0A1H3Z8I1_9BACT|nr:hypothetical protein SAMN05192529_11089 [Arachidicoccus rhizosphaerae]
MLMKNFCSLVIGSFIWLFIFSSCHKETEKDCGCGSTVITSVSGKTAQLYGFKENDKTQWNLYVNHLDDQIPYYTGVICNTEMVDELLKKEGLQLNTDAHPDQVAVVFSGDLFDRCIKEDPNVWNITFNYSFNVHLDSLALDTETINDK